MEVKALLKNVSMGPLKARSTADLIRGKDVNKAIGILSLQNKKASKLMYKLVLSAVSNAEQKKVMDADRLYVKEVYVNPGPSRKSFIPRARGSASPILKKSSHISIVLGER